MRWRDGAELHLRIVPAQPTAGWAKDGVQWRLSLRRVPVSARQEGGIEGGGVILVLLWVLIVVSGFALAGYIADLFCGYRVDWGVALRDALIFFASLCELQRVLA